MRTLLLVPVALSFSLLASAPASAQSAAGIEWKVPKAWQTGEARPMRVATYLLPAEKGDTEGAELGVFSFGVGQGGSVDANLQRWVAQFTQPDGKPSDKAAKIGHQKADGMPVTTIDLSGTYVSSMGGPMMGGEKVEKPKFRLLGAIVEGPQGSVFFKMTGPEKTVAANKKAFDALLKSLKKSKQ